MLKKCALYLLFGLLLTACDTIRIIEIETYNPGEITFPGFTGTIAVVNNAVAQPANVGYDFELYNVMQDTCRAEADSAIYYLCKGFASGIAEKKYFNDVLIYSQSVRGDNDFLVDKKLSLENVNTLCDSAGVDGLISFDRVLYKMNKKITAHAYGVYRGEIKVIVNCVVRAYLRDKENSLATVAFQDSVLWIEDATTKEWLDIILPSPETALNHASSFISDLIVPKFVPYWGYADRWYYMGYSTTWKQATAYATAQKWDKAADIWERMYKSSKKWSVKAKTALNIALSYELRGDFDKAITWAEESLRLFDENTDDKNEDRKTTASYLDALRNRKMANIRLDQQIGI